MFSHELLNILSNQPSRFSGDGNKWQQMAAFWQHPGSSWASNGPLMAAEMAANGSGLAAKWQQMAAGVWG
jgi:hypothetical protein